MRMFLSSLTLVLGVAFVANGAFAQEEKKKAPTKAYTVDTSKTSKTLKPGESGDLSFHIMPVEGKKVHPDAPLEIKLKDSPALKAGKSKLGRKDVVEKKAYDPEVRTTLQAVEKGEHAVEAQLSFFLCDKKAGICERVEEKVVVNVAVEPAKK